MRKGLVMLAALAACATVHAAPSESRADKDACLFVRTIHDFRPLDRTNLIIWAPGRRDAYLVELGFPLPELKFAHRLAVVDRNHDGMLCGYGMDRIVVPDSFGSQPSTIRSMTRLDERGLAELEAKYNVRLTRGKPGSNEEAARPETKTETK
jgi:Family of unknown function (DUF6491)